MPSRRPTGPPQALALRPMPSCSRAAAHAFRPRTSKRVAAPAAAVAHGADRFRPTRRRRPGALRGPAVGLRRPALEACAQPRARRGRRPGSPAGGPPRRCWSRPARAAVRGARGIEHGLSDDARPLLLAGQGDDYSRATFLLFEPRANEPSWALKFARLPVRLGSFERERMGLELVVRGRRSRRRARAEVAGVVRGGGTAVHARDGRPREAVARPAPLVAEPPGKAAGDRPDLRMADRRGPHDASRPRGAARSGGASPTTCCRTGRSITGSPTSCRMCPRYIVHATSARGTS